ncbi:small multidrug resistance pump [Thermosporothrix hazakensis]|uniref:Small multidrug resistance pump n=2 Tax=Thermosporothrix TaxID=768650 RepID=A0A326U1L8_THEHA|nr:multidrug efflux SMR transporter [Thermosporothrix hazakensis]PZW23581.1 small multidrug resistance pump [Thermosporothrix hazakensis]
MNPISLLFLAGAIVSEIIATSFLKASEGFTRLLPGIIVVIGYGAAFYLLSQALKLHMPLGIAYAIWSGAGTAVIALIGIVFFREALNWATVLGVLLIIVGVVVLNVFGNVH